MTHAFLAVVIFTLTIAAIVFLAGRISEWKTALIGAGLMLLCGILTPSTAAATVLSQWDVLLFFGGLATIVAAAEEARMFSWLSQLAAHFANGSERRLYLAVVCIAALVTIFLTNDAAVLFMIPLVARLVQELGLRVLPFALAVAFIANAASALLPISNPTNFIVAHTAGLTLFSYLREVGLPSLAAAVTTMVFLWVFFGSRMRERYDPNNLKGVRAPSLAFGLTLAFIAAAMVVASALRFPVGIVAAVGGIALIVILGIESKKNALETVRGANLSLVVFVASLFVVVAGLRQSGVLEAPTRLLAETLRTHVADAAPLSALFMAIASNLVNNLPMSMIAVQMLQHDAFSQNIAARFTGGAIVGLAIGANLTPIGSLSTILVRISLRRAGLEIPLRAYVIPGVIVTALTLLVASVAFLYQ